MDYRLSIKLEHAHDGSPYYEPHIEPESAGLEAVFDDWGEFPEIMQKLKAVTQAVPYSKFQWASDTALIRFDESDVLKLYDNLAVVDGLDPEPTLIGRNDFIALIDQWLRETGDRNRSSEPDSG